MKNLLTLLAFIAIIPFSFAQNIEQEWKITQELDSTFSSSANQNFRSLSLKDGNFNWLHPEERKQLSGSYIFQNNNLVLFYDIPQDSIQRFRVESLTDSTLTLTQNGRILNMKLPPSNEAKGNEKQIVKSQGFTFNSFWRGALGMFTLLVIAFLLSSNRKAINWKTVGIGLALQLLLAYGVLKVDWVKRNKFLNIIYLKIYTLPLISGCFFLWLNDIFLFVNSQSVFTSSNSKFFAISFASLM